MLITAALAVSTAASIAYAIKVKRENNALLHDSAYGVATRNGTESHWTRRGMNQTWVLLDIDYMHELNATYGYDEVNNKIKRVCSVIRRGEFVGRLFSGDELAIAVDSVESAIEVCKRLESAFTAESMSATYAIGAAGDTFGATFKKLGDTLTTAKNNNLRGSISICEE